MTTLLSLDPGRNCTGWALFHNGVLARCGLSVLPAEGKVWALGKVCGYHVSQLDLNVPDGVDVVVVEEMSVNKHRDPTLSKMCATANDLLCLQSVGAHIAGRFGKSTKYQRPFTCGKDVVTNRVLDRLTPAEFQVLAVATKGVRASLHHNCHDAIHHGLHAVGRFG